MPALEGLLIFICDPNNKYKNLYINDVQSNKGEKHVV